MTLEDARRLSNLLVTLDDAEEWKKTFEEDPEPPQPFILFEDIVTGENIRGDGDRDSFMGGLRMERATAIAMMTWLHEYTQKQIADFGVSFTALPK